MPIKVPDSLPAKEVLRGEGIFVMDESRAFKQDIRPLRIAILNLMPDKQTTEVQLLRLLGNTPLQIDVTLLHMESHRSKNTPPEYLSAFYSVFEDVKEQRFDGLVITGAPIEHLEFEEVTYWKELCSIMEWSGKNVCSTFHICWGAQAGLYYHYGIPKHPLDRKMFGIFEHIRTAPASSMNNKLLRGFDKYFFVPHSRHTEIKREDLERVGNIEILSESEESGVYLVASADGRRIFATGHSEYDPDTLKIEYLRDVAKGDKISVPVNYFKDGNPELPVVVKWRAHSNLLFSNWLNYYVYQETPYDISRIGE